MWGLSRPITWRIVERMKAKLLWRIREAHRRGVIEGVIWEVPEPIRPSEQRIKFRLAYVVAGERIVRAVPVG